MILWFDDIDRQAISEAGGKGANLGEMTRNGFPVPPGFCITTAVYRAHLRNLELAPYMALLANLVRQDDMARLHEVSEKVRGMIVAADLSEGAEQEIRMAYRKLSAMGTAKVSVRSSATAEDLPTASFAGQQETFLSVCGEAPLLAHVKACWASLWTVRAIVYRHRNGFAHEQVALAVVVQAMVQSEKSGVLFTANPVTGRMGEMMVNAAYGLGETIVSGRVTPDIYHLSKQGVRLILHKRAGTKETQMTTGPDGAITETDVLEEMRGRSCLGVSELRRLRALGLRVERHYGSPQDIEWAIAGKKLYLLQARPITAVAPGEPTGIAAGGGGRTRRTSRMQR